MANEITIGTSLTCAKSGTTTTGNTTKINTLAGAAQYANTQIIDTTPELLSLPGDLVTEGPSFVYLKNSGTNTVTLALDVGMAGSFGELQAGEAMVWRLPTALPDIYMAAATYACEIRVVAVGT